MDWLRAIDRLNPLVAAILRSPLHGLASPGLLLLTITGRRSGRRYSIPVGYHALDDAIVVMVSDAASRQWWRNFLEPRSVGLHLRGRPLDATARVLPAGGEAYRRRAEQCFRRARFVPRLFGIDFDAEAGLDDVQLAKLAAYAAIVEIRPESSEAV